MDADVHDSTWMRSEIERLRDELEGERRMASLMYEAGRSDALGRPAQSVPPARKRDRSHLRVVRGIFIGAGAMLISSRARKIIFSTAAVTLAAATAITPSVITPHAGASPAIRHHHHQAAADTPGLPPRRRRRQAASHGSEVTPSSSPAAPAPSPASSPTLLPVPSPVPALPAPALPQVCPSGNPHCGLLKGLGQNARSPDITSGLRQSDLASAA